MPKMRKITVELPVDALETALATTGAGINETLRIVLEEYISAKETALLPLREKVAREAGRMRGLSDLSAKNGG